ncbi:MAG: hypothetical protein ACE3JK_01640 [Sporolactobacillus sp.]
MRDYIPFDPEEVPTTFDIDLEGDSYTMGVNYNKTGDFYTIDLWDGSGDVIILGEKMILGVPLFSQLVDPRVPVTSLIPMDESGKETRVSQSNFGKTVFLYIDDIGPDEAPDDEGDAGNDNLNGDDDNGDS